MLTQFNGMTAKKISESKKNGSCSLRKQAIENSHKKASIVEFRNNESQVVIPQTTEKMRRPSLKEIK